MRIASLGMLALASLVGVAAGQNPPPANPPATPRTQAAAPGLPATPGQPGAQANSSSDQQIAAVLCGCAHNEIEIAKFAQSKAQSPEVKQFAEQMVREH